MVKRTLHSWLREERRCLRESRWRTTLALSALLLTSLLGIEAKRRFDDTQQQLRKEQDQAIGVLQAVVRQSRLTAQDWAHWDDSLDFVQGRNPDFAANDMGTTSLLDDGAVMVIFAENGQQLASAGGNGSDMTASSSLSRCIADVDQLRRRTHEDHLAVLCTSGEQLYVGTIETISDNTFSRKSNGSLAFLSPVLSHPGQQALSLNLQHLHNQLLKQAGTTAETSRTPIKPPLWSSGGRLVPQPELSVQEPLLREWMALALLVGSLSALGLGLRVQWLLGMRRQRLSQRRSEQRYQRRIRQMERDVELLLDQTQRSSRPDAAGAFARLLEQQEPTQDSHPTDNSAERLANRIEQILSSARSLVLLDGLTGLPNRNFFLEQLEWESEQCRQMNTPAALLFINIDKFKSINETYGHSGGDAALCHVADELKRLTDKDDFLARFSGDEFGLIINSKSLLNKDEEEIREFVHQRASNLIDEFRTQSNKSPDRLKLSLSIGIALSDPKSTSPEEMIRRSDMAMVIAKKRTSSPISIFDISCDSDELSGYRMFNALQSDIHEAPERFSVLYQPIVNFEGDILELEALVRWHNPEFKSTSPEVFIAVAERYRLINDLGELIIDRALAGFQPFLEHHSNRAQLSLAINISPSQLMRPGFGPWLLKQLRHHDIPPKTITVEVTESAVVEASEELNDNLDSLRQAGVQLALDDFGTGYSSLRLLMWLRPSELKIDKSFVMATARDPLAQQIVQLLQQLSAALGLRLVAEGVETSEIRDRLMQLGIHHFQGFLYARPQPAEQLITDPGLPGWPQGAASRPAGDAA